MRLGYHTEVARMSMAVSALSKAQETGKLNEHYISVSDFMSSFVVRVAGFLLP